jgi:hypothetical protein
MKPSLVHARSKKARCRFLIAFAVRNDIGLFGSSVTF